jgi:hypothetical protein
MASRKLFLLDSIAYVGPECDAQVVVCGSHGGSSAAAFVLQQARRPLAVLFNDAGVGKESAGIAGLAMLQDAGVACAAYSNMSARIGDAHDGHASGVISHVNAAAARLGLAPGMAVRAAVEGLDAALPPA